MPSLFKPVDDEEAKKRAEAKRNDDAKAIETIKSVCKVHMPDLPDHAYDALFCRIMNMRDAITVHEISFDDYLNGKCSISVFASSLPVICASFLIGYKSAIDKAQNES